MLIHSRRGSRTGGAQLSVWLCLPSARPVAEVNAFIAAWHAMGYKVALVRDWVDLPDVGPNLNADYTLFSVPIWGKYPGYAISVNRLVSDVMAEDPGCDWIVAAGDDTLP